MTIKKIINIFKHFDVVDIHTQFEKEGRNDAIEVKIDFDEPISDLDKLAIERELVPYNYRGFSVDDKTARFVITKGPKLTEREPISKMDILNLFTCWAIKGVEINSDTKKDDEESYVVLKFEELVSDMDILGIEAVLHLYHYRDMNWSGNVVYLTFLKGYKPG